MTGARPDGGVQAGLGQLVLLDSGWEPRVPHQA